MVTTAEHIICLRKQLSLTQKAVAEKLNLTQPSISRYENGQNIPNDVLIMMAQFYGKTTDYLLGLTNH